MNHDHPSAIRKKSESDIIQLRPRPKGRDTHPLTQEVQERRQSIPVEQLLLPQHSLSRMCRRQNRKSLSSRIRKFLTHQLKKKLTSR